ncbi:MAG TPA: hypothetical protein ENK74_01165 [Nitratifractor sp.]|nr:hypothetical protein [Nitratifractor sp.]
MIKKLNLLKTAALALTLSGCIGTMPKYTSSEGTMIVFKTPTMSYADQGFISYADSETKVEIYSSGQSVMRLRIAPSQVCMSSLECLSKEEFNKKVLNPNYPADTIERIFKGEPIFNGEGLVQSDHSFSQRIKKPGIDIRYNRGVKRISFVDNATGIKIKVILTGN